MGAALMRPIFIGILMGAALWALPLFSLSGRAEAAETISHFVASIDVHRDGNVDVIEDITVNAEYKQINHGIYRDIPTRYTDKMGNLVSVPLFIKSIQRDSKSEPYHVVDEGNGIRIYIGDKKELVPYGTHRYTLHYAVNHVVGFFPTGDELYWNVTGNGWVFPIEQASVRVTFPPTARITKSAAYTGVQGSRGQDVYQHVVGNIYEAEMTRVLNPNEGLTVFATVPVGSIQQETVWQKISFFLHDNAAWVVCVVSTLFLLGYLTLWWIRVGVDTAGVIIPRFDIPTGITPDMLRFVFKQKYDEKVFSCLFVQAAVQKFLKIDDRDSEIVLERIKSLPIDTQTAGGLSGLGVLGLLFIGKTSITIPKKTLFSPRIPKELSEKFLEAKNRHKKVLEKDRAKFYTNNYQIIAGAVVLSIISAALCFFLAFTDAQKIMAMGACGITHIFLIHFFSGPLKKYTDEGQDLADYAAGLKLYLSVAEEARMNKLYPKTITLGVFETLLPYALALDVAQEWCDHFSSLVAEGLVTYYEKDHGGVGFGWYHAADEFNLAQFANSITSISGSIASASSPPGSRSGSGGASGGGSGGGGGGGW